MIRKAFIYSAFILNVVCLSNCSTAKSAFKDQDLEDISNEVFFHYVYPDRANNRRVYVDSIMKFRSALFPDKRYGFKSAIPSSFLLDSVPKVSCKLIIPDSLANVFQYYNNSLDIACDSSVFVFASPLLPTKLKNTFLMQVFFFSIMEEDKVTLRFTFQYFAELKMEGKLIKAYKIQDSGYMGLFPMEINP